MKKTTASFPNLLLLAAPFLFSQCTYHAYFQSPFYGNSEPYHAIPLQSDSLKSATYVSGAFTIGGVNQSLRDDVYSFNGSFHRSHNFGNFQGFYGANFAVGSYTASEYGFYQYDRPVGVGDSLPPNLKPGSRFFGGYGAGGGIDYVLPFGRGSEWRVVGLSFTVQKEFGGYRNFRKAMPDSLADVIFRNDLTGVLGVSTEFAFKGRHATIGYKLMLAGDILNTKKNYGGYNNDLYGTIFFQQTLSLTRHRITGFVQFNVGDRLFIAHSGINCRLGGRERNSARRYDP